MVMTSTSASMEANLVTFIVKNLLSKDAIITFVTDRELCFTYMFILNGIFFRVKVPFTYDDYDVFVTQGVLQRELGMMWEFFNHASVRLPLNPSLEVVGIDRKVRLTNSLTTHFTSVHVLMIASRLRKPTVYPRPSLRTKRYCSAVSYALLNFQ